MIKRFFGALLALGLSLFALAACAQGLRIDAPDQGIAGEEITLTAYLGEEKVKATWTSDDDTLAKVSSSGTLTVQKITAAASVTLTATIDGDTPQTAQITLPLYPAPESVTLLHQGATMAEDAQLGYDIAQVGTTDTLSVSILPADALQTATYSSSNEDVATIDDAGNITLVGKGKTTLTATPLGAKKVSASTTLLVQTLVKGINLSLPEEAAAGETLTPSVAIFPDDADSTSVTYTLSPEDIGTVSSGKIKLAEGISAVTPVTVTATADDGSGITGTATVQVFPLASGILTQAEEMTIELGKSVPLVYSFDPPDARAAVTFKSSKPSVLEVSDDGVLTANNYGQARVTLKTAGGASATVEVTVKPAFDFTITKTTATLTAYYSDDPDAVIPDSINGLPVTIIADGVFENHPTLRSVAIPDTVLQLGVGAFKNCTALTSVTLPQSVTSISKEAFSGCTSLASINIPSGVTSIYEGAFKDCAALTAIELPQGLTLMDNGIFSGCENLREVTLSPAVTHLPDNAFERCASLERITLPENYVGIGRAAFYDCTSLKEITLPDSLLSIGGGAFEGCVALEKIALPSEITLLPSDAFFGCSALSEITLPEALSAINVYALAECTSLTTLTIPKGVSTIHPFAFDGTTLTLNVHEGSYAQTFCAENGLASNVLP